MSKLKEKLKGLLESAKEEIKEAVTRTEEEKGIDERRKGATSSVRKYGRLKKALLKDGEISAEDQATLDSYKSIVLKMVAEI